AWLAGFACPDGDPRDDRHADDLRQISQSVHDAGDGPRVAMADVNSGGPARGDAEVLDERREAQRGVGEDDVMLRGGERDQQQRAADGVGDNALQGASPAASPEADLAVGEEAAEQAGDAAEEEWATGGEHQLKAGE